MHRTDSFLSSIATSPNGWTDSNICYGWFEKSFVPAATAHSDPSQPIVLLYDGHNSHTSLEMIDLAIQNNIILFELPSHTTHRLQPCDVRAFGPLKREWNKHSQAVLDETGEPLKKANVVKEYMAARGASFKSETIRQAFYHSGIKDDGSGTKPKCDIGQFTAADFAPSISTSTERHLPPGFPADYGDVFDNDLPNSKVAATRFRHPLGNQTPAVWNIHNRISIGLVFGI